jgi:hypothetical protein
MSSKCTEGNHTRSGPDLGRGPQLPDSLRRSAADAIV